MAELSRVVEAAARRERAPVVAHLLRVFGDLDLAEDAFQESVLAAMVAWRDAVPDNPGAWLMRTARNRATDAWRRKAVAAAKTPPSIEAAPPDEGIDAISDDYLRLMFTCAHPALARDNQVALTLKVVAGFSTEEIARAFLCSEDTVSQRILRAKRGIAAAASGYESPTVAELGERVAAVLGVVYALFNEGHTARTGPLMRVDLQAEALRLGRLVCDLLPREAEAFGLLALMAFGAARADTRVDDTGLPILLADQDRTRWDRALVREGLMALQYARRLGARGPYVLQAQIAAVHVVAPRWEDTDWGTVVGLYDALVAVASSPIVALNRGIAIALRDGAAAGLAVLAPLEAALRDHHLYWAARAELRGRLGEDGRVELERALSLVTNDGERRLLQARLDAMTARP